MVSKIISTGKRKERVIASLIILQFLSFPVFPQSLNPINLQKVPQRKVREYIVLRSFDKLDEFSSIHASWKKNANEFDFKVIEETFYVKKRLSSVWDCYRHANLNKMWNGRSFRLGLLMCKYSESVIYANNSFMPDLDTGQVFFLNLRLIKGLFNIPVAFEIININNEKRIMEFSYIDSNRTLGKQTIEFSDSGNGHTRIVHLSYFKSESWLRDAIFYPYFHSKFIEEFHRNMRHIMRLAKLP